jgi:uncharacterized protein YecE (DUF72 family)
VSRARAGAVRIGCSGWNYAHWRELIYPKGLPPRRWLQFYASLFDTVEVNSTFYRLPKRSAVENWAAETPDGFAFAIKASRYLTHVKRLRDLPDGIAVLYERIEPLLGTPKLGPVLWQLPGNFRRDDGRLADALEQLPAGERHCFEFRHASWFAEDVYALLRAHGVALVIGDHPERPFQTDEPTADWTFIRLHYGSRGRNGNYSETELREWAGRVRRFARNGDVYCYFNNDWNGYAVRNAARLRGLLEGRQARGAPRG